MSKINPRNAFLLLVLGILGSLLLTGPTAVEAGIFKANNEVTYKEYWIHHDEFTGGCNDDGSPTNPYGSFYIEPHLFNKCPKTLDFTLPDDFTNAAKIELYLDLWRNYSVQAATFKINNGSTVYRPPVGADWSRTPYVMEIDKSEFNVGANTITFWGEKKFHVHDVGIRIYYNNNAPLEPGPGSDVTPPNGQLTSIQDDNGTVNPNAGGTLIVNSNTLKLSAEFSADTAYVEFHGWYEGYDEDNDTVFRDWHNLGRNNWWPGGREQQATGGVINHIGTVKPKNNATTATVTWTMPHVTNQARIKFKIRVVDAAGNVREAAGGESADFKLMRNAPVNAFIIHDFSNYGLHMDGTRPDSVAYNFSLPNSVTTGFNQAYLVGAYWRNPDFSINGSNPATVGASDWSLGIKSFNKGWLLAGTNRITYLYSGGGTGQFVELPGPMFVLRNSGAVNDNTPPYVSRQNPQPNAANVDVKSSIVAHVGDELFGVDWTTVVMKVNGEDVTNKAKLGGVMGDYRLTYKPQGNLAFSTEYTVNIDACDLLGNCMPTATYKFNTADPDTTPPTISNITVTPLPVGANISWTTNEPATSRVDYGKTQNYELGPFQDATLKTNHTAEIRGLQPDTLYHFRIKGTDEQGNTGQSSNDTFTTLEFGELLSDDFNACVLNPSLWQTASMTNGVTLFMNGEQVEINVPGGSSHDWTTGGPPRVMQAATNEDFSVEVKFDTNVDALGQFQGVLIEEAANTYVRLSFENAAPGRIFYVRFVKGGVVQKNFSFTFPADKQITMMKVTRTGDSFNWFYNDAGVWKKPTGAPYSMAMTPLKIGFMAGNTGGGGTQPAFKSVVDYFFNSALPIAPEDGAPMSVNLTQVGNGAVTKLPDKSKYVCGEEVILSATPIPGWSFGEWSGDVTGATPTVAVTIDAPKYVTATFTQDQYLLNVVIENDGIGGAGNVVTKSPEQPTYVYDDVVQLTAVAEPGWRFVQWSGGVTSTSPNVSLTMRQTETVTAHFEQEHYELDINQVNDGIGVGGTIEATPQQATYLYGDVVTLTATTNPGWTFAGWSGGASGSELSTEVTITGDTSVTATFVQNRYEINVTVVGGGGEVTLEPQQDFYLYGDMVTLTVDGGACWSFTGWGGALSGNNPTEIVTITDDIDVTANFAVNEYTLTVNKVGPGNVAISPSLTEYTCGDEITLTATPLPNNYFAGWSGDLTGAENPLTFTIEQDTEVTATFTNNPPPVVDPIADRKTLVGQLISFEVSATDSGGEAITLTAEGLPPGASFVDNGNGTASFAWWPGVTAVGQYTITFIASDGIGQGSVTMTITVEGTAIVLPVLIGG
jgi:uncharacterized repeat protein (TIGR02543 family)